MDIEKGFFIDYYYECINKCNFLESKWIPEDDSEETIILPEEVFTSEKEAEKQLLVYLEYKMEESKNEILRLESKIISLKNKKKKVFTTNDCWELFEDSPVPIDAISVKDKVGIILEFGQIESFKIAALSLFVTENLENENEFVKTPLPGTKRKFTLSLIIKTELYK